VTDIENTDGHGFATISPDDTSVVAAWKGKMWRVKRENGAYVDALPTGALAGTHPDWSPLGSELVFATGIGDAPGGSSLAKIPFTSDAWGAASVLLAPPSGKSNLFPMFSFDGAWIGFSQGKGGHGDNTAQLMVIPASGGQPIECINANRVTSNKMTDGQYQNSQPTWAPPGDLNWIAFNTKREYGVVSPAGMQQIWVAAIDVEKAKNGKDPSYPAFRVPFQGLAENNHRAFWTLDINDGTDGGGGSGGGDAGSPMPCAEILNAGDPCDPLQDCCDSVSYCDSFDGTNYTCHLDVPK
jgi:Tol biopolymer transport system component